MIGRLFDRTSREDEIFAEAQALVDDGLELSFVLDLYPDEAEWLAPLLDTGIVIGESFAVEEPSYYFEASLKNRFIETGVERATRAPAPVAEPVAVVGAAPHGGLVRFQSAMAGSAVAIVLSGLGILTFGVVTAGDSVPGDWNYAFKLAGERIEYSLSSENERTDIQIRQWFVRLEELNTLTERGKVSPEAIQEFRGELQEAGELVRDRKLNPVQANQVKAIADSAATVLNETRQQQPELAELVDDTLSVAASVGGSITGLSEPTPTPTAEPSASPTPPATETPDQEATPDPEATVTPGAEASPSTEATEETQQPAETVEVEGEATEVPGETP